VSDCSSVGKVAIVGTGAVGGFYGGMLARAGMDVRFLFRSTFDDVMKDGLSLVLHASNENFYVEPLQAYRDSSEIGVCDWVIVAAKATANVKLGEILSPLVDENTSLLTLQNGMGNVERLVELFGDRRTIVGGLCFTCINRTSPTVVESILPGYVQFGQVGQSLSNKAREIMDVFAEAGVDAREAASLDEALWRKLCWNIPFNGLSVAAGGITTDKILADPELARRARSLMEELQQAAIAYGVEIEDRFLERQFTLTEPMGPYKPSSLIDFLAGREVEVDAIWGEPLRRGEAAGVHMPELKKLHGELLVASGRS
jgi:2-dehydropantoate 2-reductase